MLSTMYYCLLSAQGPNRAGLVSEISGLLHQAQVNIMDSSMTTLRGEFVMMLLLEIPEALKTCKPRPSIHLSPAMLSL